MVKEFEKVDLILKGKKIVEVKNGYGIVLTLKKREYTEWYLKNHKRFRVNDYRASKYLVALRMTLGGCVKLLNYFECRQLESFNLWILEYEPKFVAKKLGVSVRTVQRYFKQLENENVLLHLKRNRVFLNPMFFLNGKNVNRCYAAQKYQDLKSGCIKDE